MTQNVQISTKLGDGTILVLAGDTPQEFHDNAVALVGASGAGELEALFTKLIPISGGAYTQPHQESYAPREGAGSPPGGGKFCPSHNQPAEFKSGNKNGKDWSFWKCATTGEIITDYSGNLKKSCG